MKTSAIHQAIRLNKHPDEMEWLTLPDAELPEGITDLLRLCASSKKTNSFSQKYHIDTESLRSILLNFIEKVILNETNTDEKLLGLDAEAESDVLKLHYQLLIKIYHPDLNTSSHANYQTSRITKAYKKIKDSFSNSETEYKNITLSRVPPKSFYNATKKAELEISGLRTAFFAFGALVLVSAALIVNYLYEPSKPELIAGIIRNDIENISHSTLPSQVFENTFSMAKFDNASQVATSNLALQGILRDLEGYYEDGLIEYIKPILANSPEIKHQSDEQIQAKLETLFKITQERKMLLYDFDWLNISGTMQGNGKFLSRYQMTGEESWETRKGTAVVVAEQLNGQLHVISFKLENNTID